MAQAKRDQNNVPTLLGVSNADGTTPVAIYADPTTHRLLIDLAGSSGDVVGPGSSTQDALVRWDNTLGTLVADSTVTLSDAGILAPVTSDTAVLGSTTKMWSDIFLASGGVINWNSDMTITHSADTLTFAGGTVVLGVATATSYNGMTVSTSSGTFTLSNSKVFTVSNTITLTATDGSTLAIGTGGTLGTAAYTAASAYATTALGNLASVAINTSLLPASDDGAALGSTSKNFSDVFLATGALINYANGNAVITHSSGIISVTTGEFRITSANVGTNADSVPTLSSTSTLTNKTLTAPNIGGSMTLAENASLALDPAGSADGKYTGITITAIAGYSQTYGDLNYLDPTDSRWEACDANSAAGADGDSRGTLAMVVVAGTDGSACTLLLQGVIRADAKFPTFTVNNPIYVSETAAAVTQTQPVTADVVIRVVGFALTTDEMYFNPSGDYITHT